jgi:2-aminoadipate transaminase
LGGSTAPAHGSRSVEGHADALWSRTAANVRASAVRSVFDAAMQPGMISFAGGNPSLQLLPLADLAAPAAHIVKEQGLTALQYGAGQGSPLLRRQICDVMALEGLEGLNPANVVVTAGAQPAIDVATRLFCDPGDVVLVEDPTYVGALNTFRTNGCRIEGIPTDADGMIPHELQERIDRLRADNKTLKFLYTVPNFNNPSGVSLSLGRRQVIVDICRDAGILIVEDNPYGLLAFGGQYQPPLRTLDEENVLYLGSFSKIFAPGLRLGWALTPSWLTPRFYLANESVTLCPSSLTQDLASAYLQDFDWQGQIEKYRDHYSARCQDMLDALARHMPADVTWTVPSGGFFIWVELGGDSDTDLLLQRALDAGVAIIPGSAFTADEKGSSQFRLAFSSADAHNIDEGIRRLAGVINDMRREKAEQVPEALAMISEPA